MIKLRIKSGTNAAKKGLKTGSWANMEKIDTRNRAIIREAYHRIKAGTIKGIYLQSDDIFLAIHRSTKSPEAVQVSRGYYEAGQLVPVSDFQAETPEEVEERMQRGIYFIIE